MRDSKLYFAEAIGTFALVFIATGAVVVDQATGALATRASRSHPA